jgi:hypothetical protein
MLEINAHVTFLTPKNQEDVSKKKKKNKAPNIVIPQASGTK